MDEIEAKLKRAPDEATARRYMTAAKTNDRRDDAVIFLGDLYRQTRHPGLWEVMRDTFTGPELEGLGPPEEKTVGPDHEPVLPKQPYRDVVWTSFKAPFANASSIFMLVVSGPLFLGAMLAPRFLSWVGLILSIFLFGYLLGFLFDVLEQAAQGHARAPRLLTLVWSEEGRFVFVLHFLRWLGAVAAVLWPFVFFAREIPLWVLSMSSLLLLTAAFPITLLLAAYGNGLSAFNYVKAVDRVRRLGADYGRCVAVFLVTNLFGLAVSRALSSWQAGNDDRVLAGQLFWGWATMAAWFVQMRAVGLLAWARADVR